MTNRHTPLTRFSVLLITLALAGCAADLSRSNEGEGSFALDTSPGGDNGAAELVALLMQPAIEVVIDPSTYSPGRSAVLAYTVTGRDVVFEVEAHSEHEAHELAQQPMVIELGAVHTWIGRAEGDDLIELPADPAALYGHLADGASSICDFRLLKARAFVHSPVTGPHDRTIGVIALLADGDEPQQPQDPQQPEEPPAPNQDALRAAVARWVATREEGCSLPDGVNCSTGNVCVYYDSTKGLMQNICAPVRLGCLCPRSETVSPIQPEDLEDSEEPEQPEEPQDPQDPQDPQNPQEPGNDGDD